MAAYLDSYVPVKSKNLLQHFRHSGDQGGVEFEEAGDDLFDSLSWEASTSSLDFAASARKSLSFKVSRKALHFYVESLGNCFVAEHSTSLLPRSCWSRHFLRHISSL
jgi:hypothetical protein